MVAGVILVVLLIIVATCVVLRRKPKDEAETRFDKAEKVCILPGVMWLYVLLDIPLYVNICILGVILIYV